MCVKLQVILSCPIHSSCPQPMDLLHLSIGLSVHSVFLTEFKKHFPHTVHYCCSSLPTFLKRVDISEAHRSEKRGVL